jgi:hypothetical protein
MNPDMSMDFNSASREDLERLERQIRKWRIEREMGMALSQDDFLDWARLATTWVLDRAEDVWNCVRRSLGLI